MNRPTKSSPSCRLFAWVILESAIPFEVFVEIGLELKETSPLSQTMIVSHANGSYGYLPTVQQHHWGGYETWMGTNHVEIKAAPKITNALLEMLGRL